MPRTGKVIQGVFIAEAKRGLTQHVSEDKRAERRDLRPVTRGVIGTGIVVGGQTAMTSALTQGATGS
jgi:hypothetical protein